jgi:hypothetical protein
MSFFKLIPFLLLFAIGRFPVTEKKQIHSVIRNDDSGRTLFACYNTTFFKKLSNIKPIGKYSRFFLVFAGETDTIMKYHKNPVKLDKSINKFLDLSVEGFWEIGRLPSMCSDIRLANDLKPHIFKIKTGLLVITPYLEKSGKRYYNMNFSKCLFRDVWGRTIEIDSLNIIVQANLPGTG